MFTNKFPKIPHYYNLLSTFILYPNPLTVISDFGIVDVMGETTEAGIFKILDKIKAS